jgi:hypothetical protein
MALSRIRYIVDNFFISIIQHAFVFSRFAPYAEPYNDGTPSKVDVFIMPCDYHIFLGIACINTNKLPVIETLKYQFLIMHSNLSFEIFLFKNYEPQNDLARASRPKPTLKRSCKLVLL